MKDMGWMYNAKDCNTPILDSVNAVSKSHFSWRIDPKALKNWRNTSIAKQQPY